MRKCTKDILIGQVPRPFGKASELVEKTIVVDMEENTERCGNSLQNAPRVLFFIGSDAADRQREILTRWALLQLSLSAVSVSIGG